MDNTRHGSSSNQFASHVTNKCKENEFQCQSDGSCIDAYKRCNGYDDCSDRSDENAALCNYIETIDDEYEGKVLLNISYRIILIYMIALWWFIDKHENFYL